MGKWAGKYVIGLTGNIGTGKSVVRKMLEHLGAYGIDADALGHRAIAKGAPGYQPVVDMFGRWTVGADGQVDRGKLGKIVFSDAAALAQLEKIVHPLVEQAVDLIIHRIPQRVIVVEAIKLLESDLRKGSDSIWVTIAPPDVQLARLMQHRGMSEMDARLRIQAQPPQEQKIKSAAVVINNASTFTETWRQVNAAWQKVSPEPDTLVQPFTTLDTAVSKPAELELNVVRGKPRHSAEIADLINRLGKPVSRLNSDDVMAAFGEKAYLLVQAGSRVIGIVGWQVENLVSRTTDVFIDPQVPAGRALPVLIKEMEKASKDLLCEASLVFVGPELAHVDVIWKDLGYRRVQPQDLSVLAWKEAAVDSMPTGTMMYFKQLRQDRILRPV